MDRDRVGGMPPALQLARVEALRKAFKAFRWSNKNNYAVWSINIVLLFTL